MHNFLVGWKGTANQFISDHYPGKQAEFLRIFTSYVKKHEMIAAARKFLKEFVSVGECTRPQFLGILEIELLLIPLTRGLKRWKVAGLGVRESWECVIVLE